MAREEDVRTSVNHSKYCSACAEERDNRSSVHKIVFNNDAMLLLNYTTDQYWDCSCIEDYIHPNIIHTCSVCGDERDDSPDSIVAEVIANGLEVNNLRINTRCVLFTEDTKNGDEIILENKKHVFVEGWSGRTGDWLNDNEGYYLGSPIVAILREVK